MNHHAHIYTTAAIHAEIAHQEAAYRRHAVKLTTFMAACIIALGALHVLAWQGIFTFHVAR